MPAFRFRQEHIPVSDEYEKTNADHRCNETQLNLGLGILSLCGHAVE